MLGKMVAIMRFGIDPLIFEKFPGLTLGVVVAKDVDNSQPSSDEILGPVRQEEQRIRSQLTADTLLQSSEISVWREVYQKFGAKPKDHRSSVENLYRLVLSGIELRSINKLVDIYNWISLKYMLPVGGEDLDKVVGDISLTFAGPNELEVLLLGDKDPRPPHLGEVIYKDEVSAICRRWNWREAERTKFTELTKNCVLVIEGLLPVTEDVVKSATQELADLVSKFCQGNVEHYLLKKEFREIEI